MASIAGIIPVRANKRRRDAEKESQIVEFFEARREWWLSLSLSPVELTRVQSDLDTLIFARGQIANLEDCLFTQAAQDERLPLLLQLPGVSLLTAQTLLAAIGDVQRFPDAKHLVGYAGLGGRVHDSGMTTRTGKITSSF